MTRYSVLLDLVSVSVKVNTPACATIGFPRLCLVMMVLIPFSNYRMMTGVPQHPFRHCDDFPIQRIANYGMNDQWPNQGFLDGMFHIGGRDWLHGMILPGSPWFIGEMSRSLSFGDWFKKHMGLSENSGYPQIATFKGKMKIWWYPIFRLTHVFLKAFSCDSGRYPTKTCATRYDWESSKAPVWDGWNAKSKCLCALRIRCPYPRVIPGRFQNGNSDEGICTACPLGQFRSASSATCEACALDHFADEPGLAACKPCPAQSEQAQMGQSACACQAQGHEGHGKNTKKVWGGWTRPLWVGRPRKHSTMLEANVL